MFIVAVGINHRTAPVEIREKLSTTPNSIPESCLSLYNYQGIEGCVILSTCNRTEIYVATRELNQGLKATRDFLKDKSGINATEIKNFTYTYTLYDAIRHLFRVAAGLDSMLLGETEILGQVKMAYQQAFDAGTVNRVLNVLFQKALAVGKKVRQKTGIDQNAVSISYAAVELARQNLKNLAGKAVLLIGAGKMSTLTAGYLKTNKATKVYITNRSYAKAVELAGQLGGQAIKFTQVYHHLKEIDIIISCTAAPHYVIHYQQMADALRQQEERQFILIDIAVPRDIEPAVATLPGVSLYDIDDLQNVVDANLEVRKKAAAAAEVIIEEELNRFMRWLGTQFMVPTIVFLKQKGEEIKQKALQQALRSLPDLSEQEHQVLVKLANTIANQLLHIPITQLKAYAGAGEGHLYTEILQNLFDLKILEEQENKNKVLSEDAKEASCWYQRK
ncbi:MAG TPA: glutamyl-tRNA reductase [Desulfotomaculum sp.]|nr:glutamyl-tRNA reductase [Desulfotomaculum sp.]